MNTVQAVLLGAIQGLTEFLPVSSSGHLVLFQHLFGLKEAELFFDISVHMGTLIAVIAFYRKDILSILTSVLRFIKAAASGTRSLKQIDTDDDAKLALLIAIGSVPTAVIGLLLKEISEQLFSSVFLVGCCLMITGGLLWATRWIKTEGGGMEAFSKTKALIIGVVQGLAILPGISRSGATIVTGLLGGIKKEIAARYSFLLSVPAILGAQVLSLKDIGDGVHLDTAVLAGTVTACVVGYCSLSLLIYIVNRGRMHVFAPYCWVVGIFALAIGW